VKKLLLGAVLVSLLGSESARAFDASYCTNPATIAAYIHEANEEPELLRLGLTIVDIRESRVVRAGERGVTCYAQMLWSNNATTPLYWGSFYNTANNGVWFRNPQDLGYQ
jgi:hypothetical protein